MLALLDLEFLWWLFLVVVANNKRLFWGINQSDYKKVIYNACSFLLCHDLGHALKKAFSLTLILW